MFAIIFCKVASFLRCLCRGWRWPTYVSQQSDNTCGMLISHVLWSKTQTQVHLYPTDLSSLSASHKHNASWVYYRPRPVSSAGGNTLDDITATRAHWPRDVPHPSNRLPRNWRWLGRLPFTYNGVGVVWKPLTSQRVRICAVIGWEQWKWVSVAERKGRRM